MFLSGLGLNIQNAGQLSSQIEQDSLLFFGSLSTGQKLSNFIIGKWHVAPLKHVTLCCGCLDDLILLVEGDVEKVLDFGVLEELDTEQISQAWSDMLTLDDVVGWAVCSPWGFWGVGCRQCVNSGVVGQGGEHRSRLTGLKVEDKFIELSCHSAEGSDQVSGDRKSVV